MVPGVVTRRAWSWAAACAVWLACAQGWSQGKAGPSPTDGGDGGYVGAEAGFGQVGEDFFFTVSLGFGLRLPVPKLLCEGGGEGCRTPLALGLQIPLRLRAVDRIPEDEGTLRAEDWDEPADYLRIVRFLEYGVPSDPLHVRLGELSGVVLGHGTIMNRYFNVVNIDHFQLGVHGDVNLELGGGELVLDHVLDPQVVAGRLYIRPGAAIAPGSWLARYVVGGSVAMDLAAPKTFERVNVLEDEDTPYRVDRAKNLVPSDAEVTGVVGIDQEIFLVEDETVDFIPFLDLNFHLDGSPGTHLGALTALRPSERFHLHGRMELRWLGEKYIPDYFGSIYEIERDTYFGFGGRGAPKLVVLEGLSRGALVGGYGELTFDVLEVLGLTLAYEDYQGPDNAGVLVRVQAPALGPLHLGALYRKVGFQDVTDAFVPRDALLAVEGRYHLLPFLFLLTQYNQSWRLKRGNALSEEGSPYETIRDWSVGLGAAAGF